MFEIFGYSLTSGQLGILLCVGFLIGMAKTGVHGIGMAAVPLLAIVFGGKDSSGLMLPILIFADVFGVWYYHRHAEWSHLIKLLPYAVLGIVAGTFLGEYIDDETFRGIMAVIIFASLGIMIWLEKANRQVIPKSRWFAITMGVLGGITTMIGNLAGSVMALYLLSMRFGKNEFIGTAAWFFFIINLLKVPFHILAWDTISLDSFLLNTLTIPLVALGAGAGILIVRNIPDVYYRWFIIATTAAASVVMLF